jgi:pyrroline-5-carboxylate reductase
VADSDAQALTRLDGTLDDLQRVHDGNHEAAGQDIVFLAVHPPAIGAVLDEVKTTLRPDGIAVSLAPKLTIARMAQMLGGFGRLARLIPNAPSLVGAGFNPIAYANSLSGDDRAVLAELLSPLGELVEVAEEKLEAYAILSAMGPTYFWPQFYELLALSEGFGLSRDEANAALQAMVNGALATMHDSGLSPEDVQDLVPVKPFGEAEEMIRQTYRTKLSALMEKIRPQ